MTVRELIELLVKSNDNIEDEVVVRCEVSHGFGHTVVSTTVANDALVLNTDERKDVKIR